MKKIFPVLFSLSLLSVCSSCEMKNELLGDKSDPSVQGQLQLNLSNNAKVNDVSRSDVATDNGMKPGVFDAADVDVSKYTLVVTDRDNNNTVVKTGVMSDLGADKGMLALTLNEGNYTAKAYNYDGSEVTVSKKPFFQGTADFQILAGKTTNAPVTCKLQNIEVGISLDQTFRDRFEDDYTITVDNGEGAIQTITKDDFANVTTAEVKTDYFTKYFFKTPANQNSLTVSVKATTKVVEEGSKAQNIQKTYTILKPADAEGNNTLAAGDAFIINIKEESSMVTQIKLGITVDFSFAEQEEIIEVPAENITFTDGGDGGNGEGGDGDGNGNGGEVNPPATDAITFEGLPAEYTDPHVSSTPVQVKIDAPNGIANLYVKIDSDNEGFVGMLSGFGLASKFDIANPGELETILTGSLDEGAGIGLLQPGEVILGQTSYLFDVTSFMAPLGNFVPSKNTFSIEVVDSQGNKKSGDLIVNITKYAE